MLTGAIGALPGILRLSHRRARVTARTVSASLRFEIAYRRVVPASELCDHLWMEEGFEPIYRRALAEAHLV